MNEMTPTLLSAADTNLVPVYAEIFLLIATSAILLIDMYMKAGKRNLTYALSLLAIAGCGVLTFVDFTAGTTVFTFSSMYVSDPMSNLLKLFTYLATAMTLIYSRQYVGERDMMSGNLGGEFYVLALFSMLGQMIMISGSSMLSIYLGLELMSLSLYALVALRRDHAVSTEAAMKYFVLGALASGFLLYGMSMIYGATGSLDITTIGQVTTAGQADPMILVFGLVFLVAGLAFKLGVVPFHMWVPDVVQGAPTAVTLLLGGAPKLATFAIVIRLLVEALPSMAVDWQQMLMVVAVLSLAFGNITAIAQTNIKRMLAYSTIAQMGFVVLALVVGNIGGDTSDAAAAYSAGMYYTIIYVLTTVGTFGLIMMLARAGHEAELVSDFKGLGKRSPWFAIIMTILMFSLAGVPPMVGFIAKYAVLQAVANAGMVWLAVVAVLFSLIGAFYYLRIVKTIWFDDAVDTSAISTPLDMRIIMSLNGVAIVVMGVIPGSLLAVCYSVMQTTLAK
jgi:NADH-quinone oxidoreductase subunit N